MLLLEKDLENVEKLALSYPQEDIKSWLAEAIVTIRHLQHQLNDPNYLYAGGRISRQAIVFRNEEIEALRNEMIRLKEVSNAPRGESCADCATVENRG